MKFWKLILWFYFFKRLTKMTSPNVLLSEALQLEVGGKFNTFYWNISNKININFLILIYSKRTLAWRCQIISTIWSGTSVNSRQLEYFSCPGLFEYVQFGIHNWNACECWTYVSFRYEIILNLFPFLICQRSKSSHIFHTIFFAKCLYFVFRTVAIYQS